MKNKKGFTIVELLIVIVIIAIFIAVAVPVVNHLKSKTEETNNNSSISISSKPTVEKPKTENTKNDESNILQTTYEYDTDGNVIEKSVYNPETKITTNYFYIYESEGLEKHLSEVQAITISETGEIIGSKN